MNTCEALGIREVLKSDALALARLDASSERSTFKELGELAKRAQKNLLHLGLKKGDSVLLLALPSAELYAASIALLGLGARIVFVEPFMSVHRIEHAIGLVKPKIFLSSTVGFAWGLRVGAIRRIPKWKNLKNIFRGGTAEDLILQDVEGSEPGIYTFTTGTTGKPKGVVRTHEKLTAQNKIIARSIDANEYRKPDLAIFANLVLANLAMGRATLLVPHTWEESSLSRVNALPKKDRPETLSCGPGFLRCFLNAREFDFSSLRSVHVGGALTDCALFEKGFALLPDARWIHVYGSTEAEPVCLTDARLGVEKSRAEGFFQTLHVGAPIKEIELKNELDSAWVTGPHVCEFYLENDDENKVHKRKDERGRVWHKMGDQLGGDDDGGYWYKGRSSQLGSDFLLEQRIYSFLGSSTSFIRDTRDKGKVLIGEGLIGRSREIKREFPQISLVVEAEIFRDARHRARLDREKTIQKGASWVVG